MIHDNDDQFTNISMSLSDTNVLYSRQQRTRSYFDREDIVAEFKEAGHASSDTTAKHLSIFSWTNEATAVSETRHGSVSLRRAASFSLSNKEEQRINIDDVEIIITPNQPFDLKTALQNAFEIKEFFDLIFGREQGIVRMILSQNAHSGVDRSVLVYGRHFKSFNYTEDAPLPGHDLLLDPLGDICQTFQVLSKWTDRNPKWRIARSLAAESLGIPYYDENRIVRAANSFDHIDSSAISVESQVSEDIQDTINVARELFKSLPRSLERDKCLSYLGLMSGHNLRDIVRSRADVIRPAIGELLPDLEIVAEEGVNCRNYFTHSDVRKIDYSDYPHFISFLTETLEFVFIVSDLIDCGWNIISWLKHSMFQSHPFFAYVLDYDSRSKELRELLKPSA